MKTKYRIQPIGDSGVWYSYLQFEDVVSYTRRRYWLFGESTIVTKTQWRFVPLSFRYQVFTKDQCRPDHQRSRRIWGWVAALPEDESDLIEFTKRWPIIQDYLDSLRREYNTLTATKVLE